MSAKHPVFLRANGNGLSVRILRTAAKVTWSILLAGISVSAAKAQVPLVKFEVASVKQSLSAQEWMIRDRSKSLASWATEVSGRRVRIAGISMKGLINRAYGIDSRLIVGPAWVLDGDVTFELNALMPEGATKSQIPEMLQARSEERHVGKECR